MFLPILSTALAALGVGGTPDVEFSLSTTTISENGGSASVVVTLSTTSATDVTVPYTVTGSAAVPADATVDPGPLVILAGQTQGTILVDGVDDLDAEGVERLAAEPEFGAAPHVPEILDYLADESGFLHRRADTWYWMADAYPAQDVSLAGGDIDNVL
ncbi:MAG: Calx-beta domain-containing protein, partial [Planctomycetota bacterium]